jgi:hypothetical protein
MKTLEITEIKKVKLNFSEPHITYKNKAGNKVPGVTTCLGLLSKPALIPWAYKRGKDGLELYESRDKAADVGTIIHARIMYYYKGLEVDNSNISPEVWEMTQNSMKSFYEWARPRKVKPILVEEPLISEKYQYGGTFDIYGKMDKELTLLDFKSGSGLYDEHFIQLAGYLQLLRENGHSPVKIVILNIPKTRDDSFTLKSISADEYSLELRFKKFIKLVEIWHLDRELKEYQKGGLN